MLIFLQRFISIVFTNFAINTRITVVCSIYTDVSKVHRRTSSLGYCIQRHHQKRTTARSDSIFRAELCFISGNRCYSPVKVEKIVIFSDSLSSLPAIDGFNIDNDLVQKFIKEYSFQTKQGEKKPSLYVGFQVMEVRRPILLQKVAFLSLLLH